MLFGLLLAFAASSSPAWAQDEPLGVSSAQTDDDEPLGVSSEAETLEDAGDDGDAAGSEAGPTPTDAGAGDDPADDPASESDADAANESDADAASESNADAASESNADPASALDEENADIDPGPPSLPWTPERVAAWTTFLASLGVAIAGGVLLAAGVDDRNTVENAPDGTVWESVASAHDRAPILTGVGAAVLGLGAAGAALGAGLLAYFGEGGTWLEVSALPNGITVRGRF